MKIRWLKHSHKKNCYRGLVDGSGRIFVVDRYEGKWRLIHSGGKEVFRDSSAEIKRVAEGMILNH
jgi:hypothetical protein